MCINPFHMFDLAAFIQGALRQTRNRSWMCLIKTRKRKKKFHKEGNWLVLLILLTVTKHRAVMHDIFFFCVIFFVLVYQDNLEIMSECIDHNCVALGKLKNSSGHLVITSFFSDEYICSYCWDHYRMTVK